MSKLEVFDPAMCCSSGVCGPSVNTDLVEFQALLNLLKSNGIDTQRFNLGHQPEAFVQRPNILEAMGSKGENLPILLLDGEIKSIGKYPSREDLLQWLGLDATLFATKKTSSLKVTE